MPARAPDVPLVLELVPATSWGDNLRSRLRPYQWDRVRRATYLGADGRCEICGGVGTRHPVEAHEVWDYDDVRHVQTLVGMIALCPLCHSAKHIGFTMSAHPGGPEYLARVIEHICRVNRWSTAQFERDLQRAMAQWERRSRHQWTLDIEMIWGLVLDPAKRVREGS